MARYLRERLELARAMKASPSHLAPGECDYVPPLELVGIYVVHSTITRMVARGERDVSVGTYLNAALGTHSFSILHHCTHGQKHFVLNKTFIKNMNTQNMRSFRINLAKQSKT